MPQQRQRIVFCDCLDCVQQPATTDIASSASPANEAAAKQEPPPKCLMFVLSGVLLHQASSVGTSAGIDTILDGCNLPHLNRATAQGNLCLLTQRQSSPADSCFELAQLLNVFEDYQQQKQPTSLAEKFKGMQASFASNSSRACELAASCNMSSSSVLEPEAGTTAVGGAATVVGNEAAGPAGVLQAAMAGGAAARMKHSGGSAAAVAAAAAAADQLPDPAEAARRILLELGLQQSEAGLDMLCVHVDTANIITQQQQQQGSILQPSSSSNTQQAANSNASHQHAATAASAVLSWLDRTLRYLNNSSAFKDTVLLAVLATPGAAGQLPAAPPMLQAAGGCCLQETATHNAAAAAAAAAAADHSLSQQQQQQQQQQQKQQEGLQPAGNAVLRPLQSWEQLGGSKLAIDPCRPILCMRRLPGVIRRDSCVRFSLAECCSSSGVLGLVVDRLIPEIAYKLGRAPKYGA